MSRSDPFGRSGISCHLVADQEERARCPLLDLDRLGLGMAALHARLHTLPCTGFPAPPGPFLSRCLDEMRALIHDHELHGLIPGLNWLSAQRPAGPESLSILHLDFHPLNLVHGRGYSLAALDWTEADVGDLHADIATTLMLLDCCPVGAANYWERLAVPVGRRLLTGRYLRAYRRWVTLEERKLSYYRALAAFRRLCRYGQWLRVGPQITGCKPSSIQRLSRDHLGTLQNYFSKWTGIRITLTLATASGAGS